jgi:hypothetical protein
MLCATQYSSHWMFTFFFPLSEDRFILLLYLMPVKQGSMICIGLPYNARHFTRTSGNAVSLTKRGAHTAGWGIYAKKGSPIGGIRNFLSTRTTLIEPNN